jgi:lipopolysaccharide export system protein LptA
MFQTSNATSPKLRSGFLGICLVALAALPMGVAAQEETPLTIEADDILEWNQTDGVYTAKGNAVAIQGEQEIRGNLLVATYDPESEEREIETVTATGKATFKDDASSASGSKFIYRIAEEDYRVEGPRAVVSGSRGTITADTYIDLDTRDDDTQKMTATGNAIYTDSNGRVFAGDLVNAYFAADGALTAIDAEGDVKVTSATGREANGDAATYDAGSEFATVTGNVEIIDGGSRMLGDRAEMDLKTGNSRMLSTGSGGRVSGVLRSN